MNNDYVCCLCKESKQGWGNNPYPLAEEGRCCDECNNNKVIPARIEAVRKGKSVEEEGEVERPYDE